MFNMDGEVIGINTAIFSPSGGSIGIGFAIPSNLAKQVAAQLIGEPDHAVHRGWLGVRIQAVTDEIAESLGLDKARGALVASVNDNGPAQNGGIQPGDVILTFDGKKVPDMRHLPRLVAEIVGRQERAGRGLAQAAADDFAGQGRQARGNRAGFGNQGNAQDKAIGRRGRHGRAAGADTVQHHARPERQILARRSEGRRRRRCHERQRRPPKRACSPGDVIMEAAQEEIKDPGQMNAKINDAKKAGRKSILLLVERQGDLRFVALRLDQS